MLSCSISNISFVLFRKSDCASGYCKNGPSKASADCRGTCMAKLNAGGDCSKGALNIVVNTNDPFGSGDGNACISGQCSCGKCADSTKKVPLDSFCSENIDCSSGWCLSNNGVSAMGCNGHCVRKLSDGADCSPGATKDITKYAPWAASHDACQSGKCFCSRCANTATKKRPRDSTCSDNR